MVWEIFLMIGIVFIPFSFLCFFIDVLFNNKFSMAGLIFMVLGVISLCMLVPLFLHLNIPIEAVQQRGI